MTMKSLGKVAVVTGAGTGIGKRTTLALLREGYSVVLAGRRVEPLEETVKEAEPASSQALVVPTDVSDPISVRDLFTKTKERFGRLDVLFNNAGKDPLCMVEPTISIQSWAKPDERVIRCAGKTAGHKRQ